MIVIILLSFFFSICSQRVRKKATFHFCIAMNWSEHREFQQCSDTFQIVFFPFLSSFLCTFAIVICSEPNWVSMLATLSLFYCILVGRFASAIITLTHTHEHIKRKWSDCNNTFATSSWTSHKYWSSSSRTECKEQTDDVQKKNISTALVNSYINNTQNYVFSDKLLSLTPSHIHAFTHKCHSLSLFPIFLEIARISNGLFSGRFFVFFSPLKPMSFYTEKLVCHTWHTNNFDVEKTMQSLNVFLSYCHFIWCVHFNFSEIISFPFAFSKEILNRSEAETNLFSRLWVTSAYFVWKSRTSFHFEFFFYFIVGQSQWRKCHNDSVADFVRIFCYFFGGQKYRKSKRTNERLHLNVDTSYDNHLIYHSNRLVSFDLQLKPIAHAFFATSKTIRHLKRQNERNLCRSFEHMAASWKCRQKTIQWTVFSVQRANLLANILN